MYNGSYCYQWSQLYVTIDLMTEPLNPCVSGNREMDRVYTTSQVSNIQRKHYFLKLVYMFLKIT